MKGSGQKASRSDLLMPSNRSYDAIKSKRPISSYMYTGCNIGIRQESLGRLKVSSSGAIQEWVYDVLI